jgi:translocation and assembly module TamA
VRIRAFNSQGWQPYRSQCTRWTVRSVLIASVSCAALISPVTSRAEIEIAIPDVTEAVATNVRQFLSLTRYADRKDIPEETMSRLLRRVVSESQEALQPLGYYEPQITYESKQNGQTWQVTIHVTPGRPVRLSEVTVNAVGPGAKAQAVQDVLDEHELKAGLRLNHGTYERVKANLLRAAKNDGYLDAHFTRNDLVIDREARRATIALELDTGERYHYGTINVAQDVIHEDAMRRLLRMHENDPYTLDSLLRTQYVLDDTQYFSTVDIESGTPDKDTRTVPVTLRAEPNRKHRFGTSLGYGTDTRFRGAFSWEDRLVNESGHRSRLELLGSSVVKDITERYIIPVMDVALEKLEFTATLRDEELGDTRSKRQEVGSGLTQVMGRWQRVLFLRLSNETTIVPGETPDSADSRRTQHYLIPGMSYSTVPSYIVGGRPRPYSLYMELRGSPQTLGSDASFLQFRIQAERYFDFGTLWELRLRGELGTTWTPSYDLFPASQRFFAGGERSVRGFALNELSPVDKNTNAHIGGKDLATGSIELERHLPRNFGAAIFFDAGNAFNSFGDRLEYAAGIGARYHIAVAGFGVDVAEPLSRSGNPRLHLYISTQF